MRPRVVVIAVLVAAAVAGCGGSRAGSDHGRAGYVAALNRAQGDLAQRFTALQTRISATSTPAEDRRTLTAYEGAVRDAVRRLRAVTPPDGFAALHRRFVGEVGDYGDALASARRRILSGNPRTVLAAQGQLGVAVARTERRLNATIRVINRKLEG